MADARRAEILQAIRRLAAENGGKSPGRLVFESQTGFKEGDWYGRYWSRWSEALTEAGLEPNTKNEKFDENYLMEGLSKVISAIGRFPSYADIRVYSRGNPGFPNSSTYSAHFRGKDLKAAYDRWMRLKSNDASSNSDHPPLYSLEMPVSSDGWVYLLKSGNHFKIGRSDDVERRLKEVTIALPQSVELVHAIRTDDPPGIERYWHRRFESKRANGEWFSLTISDVRAFKKRKFQ